MNRLKIYALTTDSHNALLNDWFLKTMPVDCEPIVEHMQAAPTIFREGHWHTIFVKKIDMVIKAVARNMGSVIAVSDVDIQFFRPIAVDLRERIRNYDIMWQNNACKRKWNVEELCGGFMVVKCSKKTLAFFEAAYNEIVSINHPSVDDQVIYANMLGRYPQLRFALLPDNYWLHSQMWSANDKLNIPKDIMIHHANWIVGVEHKLAQLKLVRDLYSSSSI